MKHQDYETLKVHIAAGICTVTMNRPEKFNAMSLTLRRELGDCFLLLAQDDTVRVVILTGAGKAFSAGGDINDFDGSAEEMHGLMSRISHRWFKAFWNLPQPVIAAVNGPAAGGGCNLALACDLIYADTSAYFSQTFLEIGLVPDLGGAFLLPRLVGLAKAKEMALLGERIDAVAAVELGLINAVLPNDTLMPEVQRRAKHIAARSAHAVSLTKRMMNRSFESSMEAILDDELTAQSFLFSTEANRKGVEHFLSARRNRRQTDKAT